MVNTALTVKRETGGGGLDVPEATINMLKLLCISTFKFQLPVRISCLECLVAFWLGILALDSNNAHLSATISAGTCSFQTSKESGFDQQTATHWGFPLFLGP